MKNKIKPFIRRLIIEHIFYIIGNLFILLLIFINVKIGLTQINSYNLKIESLRLENTELKNKITSMNGSVPKGEKLDEDIKFLNTLIPNVEDYFSIIYALEKLSQKTSFIITGYTIRVGQSNSEKINISVSGTGNSQSYIDFLKDYNFFGGRLITSNKIQLDSNFSGGLTIDLTFYSKITEVGSKLEKSPNSSIYKELEALKTKVNFNFEDNIEDTSVVDYPKKDNPF